MGSHTAVVLYRHRCEHRHRHKHSHRHKHRHRHKTQGTDTDTYTRDRHKNRHRYRHLFPEDKCENRMGSQPAVVCEPTFIKALYIVYVAHSYVWHHSHTAVYGWYDSSICASWLENGIGARTNLSKRPKQKESVSIIFLNMGHIFNTCVSYIVIRICKQRSARHDQ